MAAPERYEFRGVRSLLALLLAGLALMVIGGLSIIVAAFSDGAWWLLPVALILAVASLFVGLLASRIRSAVVELTPAGLHLYFPLSIDAVIPYANITAARVEPHNLLYGLGIRTNLMGHVALATAWGESAEFDLREPLRVGIIRPVWYTKANTVRVTVQQPKSLVAALNEAAR